MDTNYYAYAWGTASMRTNTIAGIMTQTGGTAANSLLSSWNPAQSSCTTIYQNFYLGAGVNIDPLIEKAEAEGAYHYEGAAYCIKAMGFMMMLDLHGELPVQEAFTGKTNPAYDDGKTMYELCMGYLDKAIKKFWQAAEHYGSRIECRRFMEWRGFQVAEIMLRSESPLFAEIIQERGFV